MDDDPTRWLAGGDHAPCGCCRRRGSRRVGRCASRPARLAGPVPTRPLYPSPVRPGLRDEHGLPALVYGYLRVTDDLDDHAVRAMERGLQEPAETAGLCFATTFPDDQPGYHGGFDELTRELQRAQAHHVVVPCPGHLSQHPLLRTIMALRVARDANARVWVVTQS